MGAEFSGLTVAAWPPQATNPGSAQHSNKKNELSFTGSFLAHDWIKPAAGRIFEKILARIGILVSENNRGRLLNSTAGAHGIGVAIELHLASRICAVEGLSSQLDGRRRFNPTANHKFP
jgi:hypothetical protein